MPDPRSAPFSISEAIRYGWKTTLANLKPLLILGAVGAVLSILNGSINGDGSSPLLGLLFQVASILLGMVWVKAALVLHGGGKLEALPKDWYSGFGNYLLSQVAYGVIVGLGLVLLIVPGVIAAAMFGFAGFLVVDRKLDAIAAFKESMRITQGAKKELVLFGLALIGINILGGLALGVGLLLSIPTSVLAATWVFRTLEHRVERPVEHPVVPAAAQGLPA